MRCQSQDRACAHRFIRSPVWYPPHDESYANQGEIAGINACPQQVICCAPVVVRIGACLMHDAAYYVDASQAHPHRLTVFVFPLLAILRNRIGL